MNAKEAYQKKMEARLAELDAEIDRLKARAKAAEADAQLEYTRDLSELRQHRDEAIRKLEQLRSASDDAVDDFVAGVENAWKELKDAVGRASSRFDEIKDK